MIRKKRCARISKRLTEMKDGEEKLNVIVVKNRRGVKKNSNFGLSVKGWEEKRKTFVKSKRVNMIHRN